jgi:hypothetical protein
MDVTEAAAPAAPPAKKREIRNSHWCVHKEHGLGMVGELVPVTKFHKYREDGPPWLDPEAIAVDVGDIELCTPAQLPAHLGYTEEQLKDLGYAA